MKPSRSLLGRSLLKLTCAAVLLGGVAQARNAACDAAANGTPGTCVARVAAVDVRDTVTRSDPMAAVGGATLALWQPDRRAETGIAGATVGAAKPLAPPDAELPLSAAPGEPPLLGLLLAVLGVVGFVAHRRGGR